MLIRPSAFREFDTPLYGEEAVPCVGEPVFTIVQFAVRLAVRNDRSFETSRGKKPRTSGDLAISRSHDSNSIFPIPRTRGTVAIRNA